ncbi:MAG: putative membrane protein, partial [Candidatus Azotimanducaceae bacterium]
MNFRPLLRLFGIGMVMGAAEIVPGVSGGSIAFITGIYER